MLKQITTVFIVLCVGILVLALAVVPHHHHNGLPCFTVENLLNHSSTCEHDGDCNNHQSCCGHHQHESGNTEEETCVFDRSEFVTTLNQKTVNICSFCLHLRDYLFQALFSTHNYGFSLPEDVSNFRQLPYLINYHSVFASRSLGLRAPPSV